MYLSVPARRFHGFTGCALMQAVAAGVLLTAAFQASAEAQHYRIQATVTHLGEVVAAPNVILEANRTATVRRTDPTAGNFVMSFLVRPHATGEVSLSFSYSSGKIDVQPNVVIPLGLDYRVTEDKVAFDLRVDAVETSTDD